MTAAVSAEDGDTGSARQPTRAFSIHAPDRVWLVRSGRLDLFVVASADGKPASARRFLLSVEQGQAAFGMCTAEPNKIALLASAIPGTELLCLPQSGFHERSHEADPGIRADSLALLESWIGRLGGICSPPSRPTLFHKLNPGVTLEVTDQPNPVVPPKGIVWVTHPRGSSRFLNKPDTNLIADGNYFPVSQEGWLQPTPYTRILTLGWEDWLEADPDWNGLQAFHKIVLQCLSIDHGQVQKEGRARLKSRADSDPVILRRALQSLASPLLQVGASPPLNEVAVADPIFLACAAVGESLGAKIIPPPEMRGGKKLGEPIAAIARASSLSYRIVALKGKWWTGANSPMVAFRDSDNRPLALLPTSRQGFTLYDPVEERTIVVNPAVALTINGFAYVFYRPLPNQKLSVRDLLAFGWKDSKRELLTVGVMGIAGGLLALVTPVATGVIFDSIIPSAQRDQLLLVASFMIVAAVAASMFTLTRNFAILRLEGRVGSSLQAAIWDRLLRLPVSFFRDFTAGDLAARSLGIESIVQTLTGSALSSILSGVFSIFSFLLLFYYSWQLALVATGLTLLGLTASAITAYFQLRYQRQIYRLRGRISGMVLEFIDNVAKLRVSGSEPRAFAAWAREFATQKHLSMRARSVTNGLTIFNSAFPVISLAVIFSFATQLMDQPVALLTTGSFLAFLAAFVQFQAATLQLSSTFESILQIVPLCERAAPIFETMPEVNEAKRYPGELSGAIELNHLTFRYQSNMPAVVRDVSLIVQAGQFVAIVGPSGSGKSTLLRLLLGFEKAESGAIYFDGQDLAGLDIEAVRRQMGVVIQNARLVSGSILHNIIGSAPFTLDEAWEAARLAGLDQDIREMPMGMHTIINEGAKNLSGGQRQRLLIARAMVKKPRIFLFDEATSALDNVTQAKVSRGLECFHATRIVVAHRLSTIINADRVFVFDKGTVVQSGTYEEMLKEEGLFRRLALRQLAENLEEYPGAR
jgi:NHLM bacteriocin system ABC transporter ATP-binding protein